MIDGYRGLAEHNIMHRDIKLENFMLHDDKVKFCDFGMAKIFSNENDK